MDIGRLEIYLRRRWHTICNSRFGQVEANVACRQLGFSSASKFSLRASDLGTPLASGTSIMKWRDSIECSSGDRTLLSCAHISGSCRSGFDAVTVECTGGLAVRNDGDLRLVGDQFGIPRSRRLEMYLQGKWGTICSHGFGETEAEVACRQLGYSSVSSFGGASEIGSPILSPNPPVEIWFSNVQCGCSDKLLACSHSEDISDCTHRDDVALVCRNRSFDEPPGACIDTQAVGIAVGVLIPALFLLCIAINVACLIVACKKRNRTVSRPTPRHASATTTAVTEELHQAALFHDTTPQAQHSTTSHPPLPPRQYDKPLPQSTLQEAPPPTYEQGVAFPLPTAQAEPPSYQDVLPPPYPEQPLPENKACATSHMEERIGESYFI